MLKMIPIIYMDSSIIYFIAVTIENIIEKQVPFRNVLLEQTKVKNKCNKQV